MNRKPFPIDPRITQLHEKKGNLDTWGQRKAADMVDSYVRFKGKFTEKQWAFVQSLLDKATGQNVVSFPSQHGPDRGIPDRNDVPVPVDLYQISGFTKFEEMLYKAKRGIRINVGTYKITLTPGISSRGANVKLDGEFVGVIRNERFQFRAGDASLMPLVINGIKEFIENPQEIAKRYGDATCECCFCGIALTDDRSIKAGYGPICAENYGLPWGETISEYDGAFDAKS